jgi:acyl-CoA synthetase
VVVGGYDGALYGLDARHGTWLWRHTFSGEIKAAACALPDGGVLAACWGGSVRALHARTGRLLWRGDVSGPVFATPLADWERMQVYVADLRGGLACFTLHDRRMSGTPLSSLLSLLWRHTTPPRPSPHGGSQPIFSAPAMGSRPDGVGVVIFGCVDANVYAVHADTGGLLWTLQTGGPVFASPTVALSACAEQASALSAAERVFIASSSGELLCADLTGRVVWRQNAQLHGHSSPATDCAAGQTELPVPSQGPRYAARVVAVGAVDGTLHLFSVANGTALAALRLGGSVFSSCVVCAGKIVVGCRDDTIYCVDILTSEDAVGGSACQEATHLEGISF